MKYPKRSPLKRLANEDHDEEARSCDHARISPRGDGNFYQYFTCYEIRSEVAARRQGPTFAVCPMCTRPLPATLPIQDFPCFPGQEILAEQVGYTASLFARESLLMALLPSHGSTLHVCNHCGWWAFREIFFDYELGYPQQADLLICGVVKTWDRATTEIPLGALRHYCAQHQRNIDLKVLDPRRFEQLVAECLRYEYRPCEVRHVGVTGGAGDGGIDLYVVKENEEWLVQVKRRLSDAAEGIDAIRQLNGVLLRDGKRRGIVVTSAPKYTRNASAEIAIKTQPCGAYSVRLIDGGEIIRLIGSNPVLTPWRYALMACDSARCQSEMEVPSAELASVLWSGKPNYRIPTFSAAEKHDYAVAFGRRVPEMIKNLFGGDLALFRDLLHTVGADDPRKPRGGRLSALMRKEALKNINRALENLHGSEVPRSERNGGTAPVKRAFRSSSK